MSSIPQTDTERKTQHPNGRELADIAILPPVDLPVEFSPPPLQLTDDDVPPVDLVVTSTAPNGTLTAPSSWADMALQVGPIVWAWPGWLAQGFLAILAGETGTGKSSVALSVARCYLRGDAWPDGTLYTGDQTGVLWCEAEAAQALNLDRAKAWHLPLDRILSPLPNPLDDVRFDDPLHRELIAAHARRDDVGLVVADSLSGGTRNDENTSRMLDTVMWFAALARDTGKPVLLLHHLRKRGILDAGNVVTIDRLRGYGGIPQPARVIWALDAPDPTTPETKRLSVIKCNLGKFPAPVGVEIDDAGVMFCAAPQPPRNETLQERAADLLMALLAHGTMPAQELQHQVEQAGVSWHAATRAKDKLGIVAVKRGNAWHWSLPAKQLLPVQ